MTSVRTTAITALILASLTFGCGDSRGPVTPGVPPANPPPTGPQNPQTRLSGSVYDTAFRPVAGVKVEVVDGASAGMSALSNGDGSFVLIGAFAAEVNFRASKSGYVSVTAAQRYNSFGGPWLSFSLDVTEAPVSITGDYTLTLVADPSCADLPEALRRRSYPVKVAALTEPNAFSIVLPEPPYLPNYKTLWGGVAGAYVAIYFAGDWGSLLEQLAPNVYGHFEGYASAMVSEPVVTTITTPFDGAIEQCELTPAATFKYVCPSDAVSRIRCESKNHTLTLTRR